MARPKAEVDPNVVEGMAGVGATNIEIAEFCGVNVSTLTRRFAKILKKSRAGMRLRLRQAQYKAALSGNVTMQIWLGKQVLGQKDAQALEHTGMDGGPIEVNTRELRDKFASRITGIAARIGAGPGDPEPNGNGAGSV